MKKIVFAAVVVLFAFASSCHHEPLVYPSNVYTDTTKHNPPPVPPVSNCNADTVYFENDILPMIISSCGMAGCHDASSHTEGINVTTYSALMASGKVRAGNPNGSDFLKKTKETKPNEVMPPPPYSKLTTDQIAKLTKWIQQGAKNNKCNSGCDTTKFKFSADVKAIIDANCKGCHSSAAPSGGVKLETYTDVKLQADNGKLLGVIGWQPGFKPMPQGPNKLPDCQITIIKKWVLAGTPNN